MESAIFVDLEQRLSREGPAAAIDRLCAALRENKDYASLFYAQLLKKRYELGLSPVPASNSQDIPEALQQPYEEAIRAAAGLVGGLFLAEGDIPRAWAYYRLIGDSKPVFEALDQFQPGADEDIGPVVEIAYHHGVHPRKGFDLILSRYGICNAITTVTGQDLSMPVEVRAYCLQRLVRALYDELCERLKGEIVNREGAATVRHSVRDLMAGRDWLFEDGFYHIDMSHLATVVQMSIYLQDRADLELARELCSYGRRLSPQFQFPGEPPFEDQYRDYDSYLAILVGEDVEKNLDHFRAKADSADPEQVGTRPAEVLINLLLRLNRPAEAVAVAREHLAGKDNQPLACPNLTDLCQRANDYQTLAEVARAQGDPVNFMAGLLAGRGKERMKDEG